MCSRASGAPSNNRERNLIPGQDLENVFGGLRGAPVKTETLLLGYQLCNMLYAGRRRGASRLSRERERVRVSAELTADVN